MLNSFDHDILISIYGFATSSAFMSAIFIFLAEWFPYLLIASVFVYVFMKELKIRETITTIILTFIPPILASFAVIMVKYVYPIGRPFTVDLGIIPLVSVSDPYGSFPSAHAAVFGALAGAMLGNRFPIWIWYLIAACLVAIARVATGVHWPSDVIVGLAFGFFVGFFVARPLSMIKK